MPDRLDASGAQLRTAEVRLDGALAPDDLLGTPQVGRHLPPCRRVVVGAIDAHEVHARPQQVLDEPHVLGSGARHGHHDADQAIARCRTEQSSRVIPQQQPAAAEVDGRMRLLGGRHPGQGLETGDDRIEPGNDVRLEDAERRKPERMQVVLQAADVALAEAQVMKQVAGAVPVMRLDGIDLAGVCRLELERAVAQVAEFGKRTVDEAVCGHRSAGLWRSTSLGRHGDGFIAVDGQRLPAPPPCHEIFMIDP